ncbi:threonine/serine exporter family protein [Clostridium sp. DL1XJH146]
MFIDFIFATLSTLGFAGVFNIRGRNLAFASLGGGIGWIVYLFCIQGNLSVSLALFAASAAVSIYSEIMARVLKKPVTIFALSAIIPLVPGYGMYYTMSEFISGNIEKAAYTGLETLINAGSIATGIILISSATRAFFKVLNEKKKVVIIKEE